MRRFRILVVVAILAGAAQASVAAAAPSHVAWSTCPGYGSQFQCGTVQVPLDYTTPKGGTISISLIRLPASDPTHRIGSLFVNPGGPGASGVALVHWAATSVFPASVRARFDIIGFDPRGVQRSDGLRCFGNAKQQASSFTDFAWPTTPDQLQATEASDRFFDDACAQRGGPIAGHMSTANAARDLDRLRAAVGDDQLSYWGVSYGSYLGVTYANLFPTRVRALVVDGIVDPIAWSTGYGDAATEPLFNRVGTPGAEQQGLAQFFTLCDAGTCAFGPNSAQRYAQLIARLQLQPEQMTFADGSTEQLDWTTLVEATDIGLYASSEWPALAQFLADVESGAPSDVIGSEFANLGADVPGLMAHRGTHGYIDEGQEPEVATSCEDSNNPTSYSDWWSAAANAPGTFGPLWTWFSSVCVDWPFTDPDRYTGPFNNHTANPVLIVGNTYDPITSYANAQKLATIMPDSRLLTINGWGHSSWNAPSQCAQDNIANYLINQQLPPAGTVCQQDHEPFTP